MLAVAGSSPCTKKSPDGRAGRKSATLFLMRGDGLPPRILGPVELIGPGGAVRLGAAKERCLLAVLALHLGEAVSQDRLAEALWGEHAPRSAANALQNYVLRLRRALQHADGVQIVTDPAGYRL